MTEPHSEDIPLVDLKAQLRSIRDQIDAAVESVMDKARFVGGAEVALFETEFAGFCGAEACVGVGNGTDALYLALRALGVGRGDEVITVSHTFVATAEAISLAGATPVFCDILPDTLLMDSASFEAAITPRTKAVIPVHLYGQACDMDKINGVAAHHGLRVIEDAAQAHGASWRGRRVGGLGDAACFSFYPGKNLGALGDGGAVVSDNAALIDTVRRLANHGRQTKYVHEIEGVNSRLDAIQAAVLRVNLRHLAAWNAARRTIASWYDELLDAGSMAQRLVCRSEAEHVHHLYVVMVDARDQVLSGLAAHGIAAGVHYPVPLHEQPAYAHLAIAPSALPVTHDVARRVLSLPMFPELRRDQVERIVRSLSAALSGR